MAGIKSSILTNIITTLETITTANSYNTNVKVSIAGLVVDRYLGYDLVNVASSSRIVTTEETHDNALHPADDGLEQIADSHFAYILREIQ